MKNTRTLWAAAAAIAGVVAFASPAQAVPPQAVSGSFGGPMQGGLAISGSFLVVLAWMAWVGRSVPDMCSLSATRHL